MAFLVPAQLITADERCFGERQLGDGCVSDREREPDRARKNQKARTHVAYNPLAKRRRPKLRPRSVSGYSAVKLFAVAVI